MPGWQAIYSLLADAGLDVDARQPPLSLSGGDISAAWRIDGSNGPLFVKTGPASSLEAFTGEQQALEALAATGTLRVPRPMLAGACENDAFLALEWLELEAPDGAASAACGRQLAGLHRHEARQFGWHRDNVIGRTPQPNRYCDDWVVFFRRERLQHQLALAAANGFGGRLQQDGQYLCDNLGRLFDNYRPRPSLLHGDLWGGNWAVCGGQPVVFDPASYYGDRESDIAMTRLFGGFSRVFYAAYEEAWPPDAGYRRRQPLYQLYHVLNHLNLFGGGYHAQAQSLLTTLRASV